MDVRILDCEKSAGLIAFGPRFEGIKFVVIAEAFSQNTFHKAAAIGKNLSV